MSSGVQQQARAKHRTKNGRVSAAAMLAALQQLTPVVTSELLANPHTELASQRATATVLADPPRSRSKLPTDPLLLQRALSPALAEEFARELARLNGKPDVDRAADFGWLGEAGELANYYILHWRNRRAYRRRIHRIIDKRGLRRGSAGWEQRREAAYWQAPGIEPVVELYGGRFGRWRPMTDPELGTVPAAIGRMLIQGLGSLVAVAFSHDPAQQARLAIGWVSTMPGQLWTLLRTGAIRARKFRDPGPLHRRRRPPLLDNVIDTFGGAALDVSLRMAASHTQGGIDPALGVAISGRRLSDGLFGTITELNTFDPMLIAELIHERAMVIAARGEPANELQELERQSRYLHLALDVLYQGARPDPETIAYLIDHQARIDAARKAAASAGLSVARIRTNAGPCGVPRIRKRSLRWMRSPFLATTVAFAGAALAGQVWYGLLALPSLAIGMGTIWTMRKFRRDRVQDQMVRAVEGVGAQGQHDDEVRTSVRDGGRAGKPMVSMWSSAGQARGRLGPELKQTALLAMPVLGAGGVSLLSSVTRSLAAGLMALGVAGLVTNQVFYWLWQRMVDGNKQHRADINERSVIRKLAQRLGNPDAALAELKKVDTQLDAVTEQLATFGDPPSDVKPGSELAALYRAVADRGSAVLARRWHMLVTEADNDADAAIERVAERAAKAAMTAEGGRSNAVIQLSSDLETGKKPVPATVAAAFDFAHEHDLGDAATAELLDACLAEWLEPHERLCALNGGEWPALTDEAYIELAHTMATSPHACRRDGGFRADARLLALSWRSALSRVRRTADSDNSRCDLFATAQELHTTGTVLQHDVDQLARQRTRRLGVGIRLGRRQAQARIADSVARSVTRARYEHWLTVATPDRPSGAVRWVNASSGKRVTGATARRGRR